MRIRRDEWETFRPEGHPPAPAGFDMVVGIATRRLPSDDADVDPLAVVSAPIAEDAPHSAYEGLVRAHLAPAIDARLDELGA